MIKKPTSEFMNSFGKYVYCYTSTGDYKDSYYKGKGKGTRCLDHLSEKDYDFDDLHIVACNLEKFDNRPEVLLESWLIWENDPEDNKVSGFHKECFIMSNLGYLFDDYQAGQRNMLEEGTKFMHEYLDKLGLQNSINGTKSSFKIGSSAINSCYINLELRSDKDYPVVHFATNKNVKEFISQTKPKFMENYPGLEVRDNSYGFEVDVTSVDEAFNFWNGFHGIR